MSNVSRTGLRRWLTLTALVLVAIAVLLAGVAAVDPSLLGILDHPRDDVLLVTGFFVVAVFGISLLLPLHPVPAEADADTDEPEITPEVPYAGAGLESLVASPVLGYRVTRDEQAAVRARLREAAVDTIRRHAGIGVDDARARVHRGDWTENPTAAWFLGETPPPLSVRLYARVSDTYAFRHGARQTVHEIVAYERRRDDAETRSP